MKFCIGEVDYSECVDWKTYQMNQSDEYDEWTDGYRKKHRIKARTRISGTLHLGFKNDESYDRFVTNLENNKKDGYGYISLEAYVTNLNEDIQFLAFADKTASVYRNVKNKRVWADVSLTVEEV